MAEDDVIIIISDDEQEISDEIRNFYALDDTNDCVLTDSDVEWADGNWLDSTWNEQISQLMNEWEWEDGDWVNEIGEAYWELIQMEIAMQENDDGNDSNDDDVYDEYEPIDAAVDLRIEWRGLSYHEFANIEEQFAENSKLYTYISDLERTRLCMHSH